ncbi:MAG: flagellar hook capping FlgD N-terminal domain-containing protein [Thermoguttaceae bacterium]|jgi:flagellar basal-body rod modification protein FlgD
MAASSVSNSGTTQGTQGTQAAKNRYEDLGMEEFLQMMIVELQHQDPMNPMSNQEMMAQIGQIREIESNTRLTETLDSLQLGQSMATASNMIGKTITGLPDGESNYVTGVVDSATVIDGKVKLLINGEKVVSLDNVGVILGEESSTETDATEETGT